MDKEDQMVGALYDGRDAAREGKQLSDCPFPAGTLEGRSWEQGYRWEKQK